MGILIRMLIRILTINSTGVSPGQEKWDERGTVSIGKHSIEIIDILDNEGDYIKIPRVLDGEPLMFDINSESSGIKDPGD